MSISGGMKFFDKSLAVAHSSGVSISASEGDGTALYAIDKRGDTNWSGSSSDITRDIITLVTPSITIDRLILRKHNWKGFHIQYDNGSGYTDFQSVVGLDGAKVDRDYASFPDQDSYVSLGTTEFNPDYNAVFTVAGWFNANGAAYFSSLLSSFDGVGASPYLDLTPGDTQFQLAFANSPSHYIAINAAHAAISLTAWHHVAVVYSGSGVASGFSIYLNGVLLTNTILTNTLASNTTVSSSPMVVGQYNSSRGLIDNLGIYKGTALNGAAVAAIYAAGRTGNLGALASGSNLTYWYEFNGNATDSKGVNNGVASGDVFLTGLWENAFADTTAYYEFTQVANVIGIRAHVNTAQVANAQKYIFQIIPTVELGTLLGFPKIMPVLDANAVERPMLSGLVQVRKSTRTFEYRIRFDNYPPSYAADIELMLDLFDREEPFLAWACGGRRGSTYFGYQVRGFGLDDVVLSQTAKPFKPQYLTGIYKNPIDLDVDLVNHV